MRRHLEDLFQAAAAVLAGLLLLWSGLQLRSGSFPAADPWPVNSLADLQHTAGLAACAVGLLVLGWWMVGLAAGLVSAVLARQGRLRAAQAVGRISPGFLRRLAAASLGVQLLAGPFPAALAASPGGTGATAGTAGQMSMAVSAAAESGAVAVDPWWQLEPEGSRGQSAPVDPAWKPAPDPVSPSLLVPPGSRADAPAHETVTVTGGDTLWDLAARQLGSLATETEIAELWPRWYELNRFVVGPDPDVLLPGQVLVVPPLAAG